MAMSTIAPTQSMTLPTTPESRPPLVLVQSEQRIVIRDVGRDTYQGLCEAIGEGQHVRLAYDGKDLEIMVTTHVHEHFKELLGKLVNAVTLALEIDHVICGETTWDTEEADRGLQADHSYCFEPEKIAVARTALARRSKDPADYPSPDLAVEIDISPPKVDRSSIYAALRVLEVWRFTGQTVVIEQLQADGSYAAVANSRFLPVSAAEITRWLLAEDASLPIAWGRRLNAWAAGLGRQA
jgi:Uma2 family endonuclease